MPVESLAVVILVVGALSVFGVTLAYVDWWSNRPAQTKSVMRRSSADAAAWGLPKARPF